MLSEDVVRNLGRVTITDTAHPDELLATNQPVENIYVKKPEWSIGPVDTSNVPTEDAELSSLDSFALTDSPEGTVSSRSQKSSHSSLSGLTSRKSPIFGSDFASTLERAHKRTVSSCASSSLFSADMDKSFKSEYTVLKNQCLKFASQHNAVKANFLRLTLLPFLRKNSRQLLPPSAELEFPLKVLSKWWSQLLNVACTNFKNVSGVDRNAFYEAISALMSRPEWIDQQEKPLYQSLLAQTTNHILTKCSTTSNLSIAQGAFAGKVIAYAYAFLPGFAAYFLGIFTVDERVLDRIIAKNALEPINILSAASAHLKPLINARSLKNVPQKTNFTLNSEQRIGLTRHMTVDSTIFASFFKHFCTFQSRFLPIDHHEDRNEFMEEGRVATLEAALFDKKRLEKIFLASPGTLIILARILSFFDRILFDMTHLIGPRNSSPYGSRKFSRSSPLSESPTYTGTNERVRIDHLKIFDAFREILHCDEETSPYFLVFSSVFDRIFKAMATEVRAHDMEGCVMVCNLVEEWFSSVFSVSATKSQHTIRVYRQLVVDWQFWLHVVERMLDTENSYTNIRALSFLFNIWPHLPNDESIPHLEISLGSDECKTDKTYSVLQKAAHWIVSPSMWLKLFCNWSPLVRSYYHRLLCYRLASVGVGTKCWFLDVESANDLEESRQLLENMLSYTAQWCLSLSSRTDRFPETEPSLPLPRLRVGIRQVGPILNSPVTKGETNLSKVYMFDIFDTAAYLKANQESLENGQSTPPFGETPSDGKTQVCRKSSRVSRISVDSADSVRSNSSVLSTLSVRNVKSQIRKMSSFLGGDKADYETESKLSSEQSSAALTAQKKETPKQNSSKRWSLWNKVTSKQTEPIDDCGESSGSCKTSFCESSTSNINEARAEKNKSKDLFTSPFKLTELRPEILRPSHKFVMIPTSVKPPSRREISMPFMPFSRHDFASVNDFDPVLFESEKDLAIWNYGGRSLAEWNLEVLCFEHYAKQQRQVVDDTLGMFMMPFLVAEISWRCQV